MDSARVWKSLLIDLLQGNAPELAARLRQRLIVEGQIRGHGTFDHKIMGYRRFKDFLAAFPETFELHTREGGEMVVCLRSTSESTAADVANVPTRRESLPAIRDDIWIAFSNPDPRRVRFYNRLDGRVFHALIPEGQGADSLCPSGEWVRIEPIGAEKQSNWMREFVSLHPDVSSSIQSMLEESYSTPLNVRFTRSLGPLGKVWTQFRLRKVIQEIQAWATEVGIPLAKLSPTPIPGRVISSEVSPLTLPVVKSQSPSAKARALKLIDTLTEDEIANYVIPLLASVLMVKARQ